MVGVGFAVILDATTLPQQHIRPGLQLGGCPDGHGGFSDDEVIALHHAGEPLDHGVDVRGVCGIRTLALRGAHADEVHVRELGGAVVIGGEGEPAVIDIPAKNLWEPGFEEGNLSCC